MTPAGGRTLTTYVAGGVLCAILMVGCALTGDDEQYSQPLSVTPTPPSDRDEAAPPTLTNPINTDGDTPVEPDVPEGMPLASPLGSAVPRNLIDTQGKTAEEQYLALARSWHVGVFVCSPRPVDGYDFALLGSVDRFFLRESSGLAWVLLTPPRYITAPMDWQNTTIDDLFYGPDKSACDLATEREVRRIEDEEGLRHDGILLFVDVPPGRYAGYAHFGGIARVSLPAARGHLTSPEFQALIAHELGHSLLHLDHTDASPGTSCFDDQWALMRSGVLCPIPAGADLLDLEIVCHEREEFGWPCKGEEPGDIASYYIHNVLNRALPEAAMRQFGEGLDGSPPDSFEKCADSLLALSVGVFLLSAEIDIFSDYSGYQSEVEQRMEQLPKALEAMRFVMNDLACSEHISSEGLGFLSGYEKLWLWGTFEAMLTGSPGSYENR